MKQQQQEKQKINKQNQKKRTLETVNKYYFVNQNVSHTLISKFRKQKYDNNRRKCHIQTETADDGVGLNVPKRRADISRTTKQPTKLDFISAGLTSHRAGRR